MPRQEMLLYATSVATNNISRERDLAPISEHSASRYPVGMRVSLGWETWGITALGFIFGKATLLRE